MKNPTKTNSLSLDKKLIQEFQEEMKGCLTENGKVRNQEDIEHILSLIPIMQLKKGTILLSEGEIGNACYSILKGCVRQYYLIDGNERTTFFYTEGHSIYAQASSTTQTPIKHYLCCVEDTILTMFTRENEKELFEKFPQFETLSRKGLEMELMNYQEMLASYITTSPEERYSNLLKNRPELLNRVPHHQLASFIGIKPESLSRIRKRIMQKQ